MSKNALKILAYLHMKLKDLKEIWHVGSNYAILSLPFVSYSVQPHWRNKYESSVLKHRYVISYKSSIVINQSFEEEYDTIAAGMKGCEKHLQKLMDYLFMKLESVVEINEKPNTYSSKVPANYVLVRS